MLVIAVVLSLMQTALAKELVPGGKALGIRMSTDGAVVAELTGVDTPAGELYPAAEAGIMKGDVITRIGASPISTAEQLGEALRELDGQTVAVTVRRGDRLRQYNVTPVSSDGEWRLGLVLRNGISGVGTLTFYDPETGVYGALGHSISDSESGTVLPLGEGSVFGAGIESIDKGKVGAPGALNGRSDEAKPLGDIRINCDCGIFGAGEFEGEALETGEITPGRATILCTLGSDGVREYEITVKKVFDGGGYKAAVLSVTDPGLLERTGGIVQGISGSPILQDGRIVGAVTHVFVNDPSSGYGIGIRDMLSAAQSIEKAA